MFKNKFKILPHSRPWIIKDDIEIVKKIIKNKMISTGEVVQQFEKKISKYLLSKYSFAQSSGTTALILSLNALNIKPGDGVILPSYVCKNVLEAVLAIGSIPQLCDVNENGVITEKTVKKVFNKKSKAIIAVHIYGNICDVVSLRKFQVPIIEDACQAFGLDINGKKAGTIGDLGVLSFNATKCLATGEGGMVVTNSYKYAKKIKKIIYYKDYDSGVRFQYFNSITNIQAAMGISQLKRYNKFLKKRKYLFDKFYSSCQDNSIKIVNDLKSNMKFRFVIKKKRSFKYIEKKFLSQNIIIRKGVDQLLHRILNLNDKDFRNSVELFNRSISIPFYPSLSNSEINRILNLIVKI